MTEPLRLRFDLAMRTHSATNSRGHWRKAHSRGKEQQRSVLLCCADLRGAFDREAAVVVHFTRIAPRELDDDNLRGAFKAVRDAIAKLLERDDRPGQGVEWRYSQQQGAPKSYGIRIEVWKNDLEQQARDSLSSLGLTNRQIEAVLDGSRAKASY